MGWKFSDTASCLPLGAAYLLAASLAIELTRFDGGLAFLWVASAILIAALVRGPRRAWPAMLAICGVASFLATGALGLGWMAAPAFVVINLLEGLLAARVMCGARYARQTLESRAWLVRFVIGAGVVSPLAGAVLTGCWMAATGRPVAINALHFFASHALGNLTFAPLAMLIIGRRARLATWRALRDRSGDLIWLFPVLIATTVTVFAQNGFALLFLPILPLLAIAFRMGREGAALALVVVAIGGGAFTIFGCGPTVLVATQIGDRLMFLQFYLAATVLTLLPVVTVLRTRERLEVALRSSETRYRLVADHCSDVLMKLRRDGRIVFLSPSIRQLGPFDPHGLIGCRASDLVAEPDRARMAAFHQQVMAEPTRTHAFEFALLAPDGSRRWLESHSRAVVDAADAVIGTMSIIRDVTDRKAAEMVLTEAARTDALTGLPNRRALRELLDGRGGSSARDCIALIDIDHFKRVNDRHGHAVGDIVLRNFAAVAVQTVREGDMVARLGGEEFVVFLPDTGLSDAMAICERLRIAAASAVTLADGAAIRITISGGVAAIEPKGLADALNTADRALYEAKRRGRDQLAIAA